MIGQMLSHYLVLEQIGAGGMGVVYRAHDQQLDRDVAIKVLPVGTLADEASRARFRKEALALAKLDHPNIATIFEFSSQDGNDFLVTAYIPGITLDAKLASQPLPPEETIALGVQFAKGLAAAHEQGVIHRDLKPGNLRLTPDGLLKILDFGLARLDKVSAEPDTTTTVSIEMSQQITGTLPYMAPEQLRGERADTRSDVWGAGTVLYEMATGSRPFPEKQGPPLIDAILNTEPRPPSQLNRAVSPGLENVILKTLDKDPGHRYQTANELRIDLERLMAGTAPLAQRRTPSRRRWIAAAFVLLLCLAAGIYFLRRRIVVSTRPASRRSVAVLGFKNLGGKAEESWISTALAEMLTTELGAGGELRTIPGESVARMKADLSIADSESLGNESLAKIYQSLGSNLVVLGSYLDLGGKIRVDLRVQDTSAGETIATVSQVGTEEQFFDLVKRTGESLRSQCGAGAMTAEESAAARAAQPANTQSARLYAEGLTKLRQFDPLGARDLLTKAVAADPKHALAHSALAAAWSQLGYDGNASQESKQAFELSANLPRKEKLSIEAQYREDSREWDKAVDIYHSLWLFFPDDLEFGLRLADAQISAGKGEDALATLRTLHGLAEPSRDDPRIDLTEAVAYGSLSNYKQEQVVNQQAIDKSRRQGARLLAAEGLLQQCWALRNIGNLDGAKAAGSEAKDTLAATGDLRQEARSLTCVATVLADQGNLADAKAMREQALSLARKIGAQKDIAGALINLANILAVQQKLDESTQQYREALKVAVAIGDKFDAQLARNNIGVNLTMQCDFAGAEKMLEEALQTSREIGDQSGVAEALRNLGTVAYSQGDFAPAKSHLSESLAKSRELGLQSGTAATLATLGELAMAEDDLAAAEKNFQESLSIETQIGEKAGIAAAQLELAGLELEKNQPGRAAGLAQQAAQEFQAEKNGDQEAAARNLIAQALMAQNQFAEAQIEVDRARQLTLSDRSIELARDLTGARLAGAMGKNKESLQQLSSILLSAKQMKLRGYEFQTRLALADLQRRSHNQASFLLDSQELQKDATRLGYKLIARKAGSGGKQ
jgi:tetratricopeptide (TPR) repeat protein